MPISLKDRRLALGLSRRKLAALMGLNYMTIWRWESYGPSMPILYDLALAQIEQTRKPRLSLKKSAANELSV